MPWFYIELLPACYFPMWWWSVLFAPASHEVIRVDFRRRQIVGAS